MTDFARQVSQLVTVPILLFHEIAGAEAPGTSSAWGFHRYHLRENHVQEMNESWQRETAQEATKESNHFQRIGKGSSNHETTNEGIPYFIPRCLRLFRQTQCSASNNDDLIRSYRLHLSEEQHKLVQESLNIYGKTAHNSSMIPTSVVQHRDALSKQCQRDSVTTSIRCALMGRSRSIQCPYECSALPKWPIWSSASLL